LYVYIKYAENADIIVNKISIGFVVYLELKSVRSKTITLKSTIANAPTNRILNPVRGYTSVTFVKNVKFANISKKSEIIIISFVSLIGFNSSPCFMCELYTIFMKNLLWKKQHNLLA
jgi:hypothetical protein